MFSTIYIKRHERGLLFKNGDFVRPLGPGRHFVWAGRVEIVDTLKTRFEHPLLDVLIHDPRLREQLAIVELTDAERAVIWKDGRAFAIGGAGRHAFWREPARVEV